MKMKTNGTKCIIQCNIIHRECVLKHVVYVPSLAEVLFNCSVYMPLVTGSNNCFAKIVDILSQLNQACVKAEIKRITVTNHALVLNTSGNGKPDHPQNS